MPTPSYDTYFAPSIESGSDSTPPSPSPSPSPSSDINMTSHPVDLSTVKHTNLTGIDETEEVTSPHSKNPTNVTVTVPPSHPTPLETITSSHHVEATRAGSGSMGSRPTSGSASGRSNSIGIRAATLIPSPTRTPPLTPPHGRSPHSHQRSLSNSARSSPAAAYRTLAAGHSPVVTASPGSQYRSLKEKAAHTIETEPQIRRGSLKRLSEENKDNFLSRSPQVASRSLSIHGPSSHATSSSHANAAASASPGILPTSSGPNSRRGSFSQLHGINIAFKTLLQSHTAQSLINPKQKLIQIDSNTKPMDGFETLLKANILSAPVYDSTTGKYTGFLDLKDLVSSIIFSYEAKDKQEPWTETWTDTLVTSMQRWGSELGQVTLSYLSRRHPFRAVSASTPLDEVARLLSTGLHRVPVTDESGKCISIISQSTFITFFNQHLGKELHDEAKQTVASLGVGCHGTVIVASADMLAIDAFKLLDKTGKSGIGVIDSRDGKLIGHTSAKDLKFFVLDRGQLTMEVPILEYLAQIRQREIRDRDRHPACSVHSNQSIGHVIGLLAATGYHRVFVVDDKGHPTGVISITDLLRWAIAF